MKKRPNATPSGPAGHSRQAFQGGTYSLMLTAAVLALLIVLNLLVSALPTNLTQYDISMTSAPPSSTPSPATPRWWSTRWSRT